MKRAPSTNQSLQINSNIKKATILKNGLYLGNAGQAFDIANGVHELIVTSPGHVPRMIQVKIQNQRDTVVQVNLIKVPKKRSVNADDFEGAWGFKPAKSILDLKSLCSLITAPPGKSIATGRCNRKTLFDEFKVFPHSFLEFKTKGMNPTVAKELTTLKNSSASAGSDSWNAQAESIMGKLPGFEPAYAYAAYSAFIRQDCKRVYQIVHEHGMHGVTGKSLRGIAGYCFELEGKDSQAASLFKQSSDKQIDMIYHFARTSYSSSPAATEDALLSCLKLRPGFYPCLEPLMVFYATTGKEAKAQAALGKYNDFVKKSLAQFYKGIFKNRGRFPYQKQLMILEKLRRRIPYSYTAGWDHILTIHGKTPLTDLQIATAVADLQLSDLEYAKLLVKRIRALNKPEYLEQLMWRFVATYPRNPLYWVRLAEIQKRKTGCVKALDIIDKALKQPLKSRKGLVNMKGECHLQLGQYQEAEKMFLIILNMNPDNWKVYWNLGIVKEEMGLREEGLRYYREALVRDPPEINSGQLLRKIEYLERKDTEK